MNGVFYFFSHKVLYIIYFFLVYCSPVPCGSVCRPIWRAFSISSHSSRFEAMPALDAIALRKTRKESNTPSWIGSMGWPVVKFRPTMLPSACSSVKEATCPGISACIRNIRTELELTSILDIVTGVGGEGFGNDQQCICKCLYSPLGLALDLLAEGLALEMSGAGNLESTGAWNHALVDNHVVHAS